MKKEYLITPISKPRMTRRDKWLNPARPAVARFRSFCNEIMAAKVKLSPSDCHVTFILPLPDSTPKKIKLKLDGMPHMQKPDLDNCLKALLDSLFVNDSIVWDIRATKKWGREGKIVIETQDYLD
jgi:Holliday junction resolvase RusA-like endonuclease